MAGGLINIRFGNRQITKDAGIRMRRIFLYSCFVLSVAVLATLTIACAATYSRPYVRMEQDKHKMKLFMSHHGQVRWFSFRLLDQSWELSGATPGVDSISISMSSIPIPRHVSSSDSDSAGSFSVNAGSFSLQGAMMIMPFSKGWLPHWGSPLKQIRELQIPYWPALAIAFLCTALSGRFVFKDLRSRRRAKAGLCRGCAYDLRATPDCCPECGLVVSAHG